MRIGAVMAVVAALAMPGLAAGQSNPITGSGSGQVHGQNWNMGQDLHSTPGPGAAPSRNDQVRQRSQAARSREGTTQRRGADQARRSAEARRQAEGAGRSSRSQASVEQRLAEERRRQAEAEERAARAFPGVR
jgi:hypothetical protein